jgi:hypothetical protein
MRRLFLALALMLAVQPRTAMAVADPPHNVAVTVLISSSTSNPSTTSCSATYQHGNVFGVGYAKIRRGFGFSVWPFGATAYATPPSRYEWGANYPNLPSPPGVRCNTVAVNVGVLSNGVVLQFSNSGSGGSWVQANGPVYSTLIGGTGYTYGAVVLPYVQPVASRGFPGI